VREVEIVLLLLVLVAALTVLARRVSVPYPILMTVGGLGLSVVLALVPGAPEVSIPPELIFLLFLPPILFSAAYFTSPHELKMNARPIGLLAVGLVLVTMLAVGFVAHSLVPSMGWAAAFALGAIVSPPDAVSATSIAQRLGLPRRVVTILEGESLVNDATALVALRLAIAAIVSGAFSLPIATFGFLGVGLGGVACGLAVGWAVVQVTKRLSDPPVAVLVSLLAPFAAWIPAETLQVSGVLSVVTAGIVLGRAAPRVMSSDTRILGSGAWQMVIFVLNGLVFILIGLQLPTILGELRATWTPAQLAILGVAVSLTVVVVRMIWVFPATYLPRWIVPGLKERDPAPPPQIVVIIGWAGMRGVVSLAAALALPLTIDTGGSSVPFPARDLLVFLTFAVILVTLVGQGLTLPWLIRRLGVGDDGSEQHDEIHAREAANAAALERLDELAIEWPGHLELIDQMRARYQHAAEHLEHEHSDDEGEIPPDQEMIEHAAIRQAVIDAQRVAIIDLRDRRVIGDPALRRVERDLDLEELRAEG
jgi:CPA1 family monovalent cation:H+ antiporter